MKENEHSFGSDAIKVINMHNERPKERGKRLKIF